MAGCFGDMARKCFVFALLFTAIWNYAAGQPTLKMRTFNMSDGLPSNSIANMSTAANGMLWIASWNGLCNYDGYRFNSFVTPTGVSRVLNSNRLSRVAATGNGNVWVTSFDDRLFLYDAGLSRFVDMTELEGVNVGADFRVSKMYTLPNGALWILGKDGMNLRVSEDEISVVPTAEQGMEICSKVIFAPDSGEWLVGEHSTRKYGSDISVGMRASEIYIIGERLLFIGDEIMACGLSGGEAERVGCPENMGRPKMSLQASPDEIAVASDAGIFLYSNGFERIYGGACDNLFCDSRRRLWGMRADGSAVLVDETRNKPHVMECPKPAGWPIMMPEKPLVHEDMNGTVWFLIKGAPICYYDEERSVLTPIDLREINNDAASEVAVSRVISDQHKNLWFSSNYNLIELMFCNYRFRYSRIVEGTETRTMMIDREQRLWVGTKPGYIAIYGRDRTLDGFVGRDGKLHGSPIPFCETGVYVVYEDSRGRVWVGTRGDGLFLLVPNGNGFQVSHFMTDIDGVATGREAPAGEICGSHIYDILEDDAGRIWFATYRTGIMFAENVAGSADIHFVNSSECPGLELPEGNIRKVRRIERMTDGTMVLSTSDGIIILNPDFNSLESLKLNITRYHEGNGNGLLAPDVLQTLACCGTDITYLATMGGGLQTLKIDRDSNTAEFAAVEHGFINVGNIRGMVEDPGKRVWIVGENAIYSMSADGTSQRVYSSNQWGRDIEFSEAKPIFDSVAGCLIAGTQEGMIMFNPEDLASVPLVPPLVFTGIHYQGEESITPLTGNAGIELPVDRHNAIVYFSALDYEDNSHIRYAYRLRERDAGWSYVGAEHCAPLSNLPPGHYTLEVRSTDNQGVWTDNNAELKIYVVPTFWQTTWAWVIYICMFALLVYGIVRMFQLRNAQRMEKEINRRQLRFFTDISHRLRTPLTLIGQPVTEVLQTETLSERGRDYLRIVEKNASRMLALVNRSLDLKKLQYADDNIETATPDNDDPSQCDSQPEINDAEPLGDLTILVVEDNDELRYFLTNALSSRYRIIEAENGRVGLRLAEERQPDFVITDIMMPEMDGITMIRHIKRNEAICHIPIIILSARTADIYRIEGLREGADDYITKPFSVVYLQVRVESIVRQRRLLQQSWRDTLEDPADNGLVGDAAVKPEPAEASGLNSIDRKFTERLTAFINENIGNDELRIDNIAAAMNMSRTVLYGKIKAIYGVSPNDVLRNMRMARACTLLREGCGMSIAEVAAEVGYTDPKHFARTFKQHVGVTPSEYRKN